MDQANIVIIGGGVIGSAIACALSKTYSDVFVLEALPRVGMLTSTRNSGVIHSGIYYVQNSLKARLCVRGNVLTYEFCAAHGVPCRNIGKIVVAPSESVLPQLEALKKNGEANGVANMRIIDRAAFRKREPHVEGFCALEVPSTGILSSEDLVKAYRPAAPASFHSGLLENFPRRPNPCPASNAHKSLFIACYFSRRHVCSGKFAPFAFAIPLPAIPLGLK